MDGGAWWAANYGVAQSRTQLKRLSSSSSNPEQYGERDLGECFQLNQVSTKQTSHSDCHFPPESIYFFFVVIKQSRNQLP